MSKRKVVWWKVIVGLLLIFQAAKTAFFPEPVPPFLQASNPGEEFGMKLAYLLIAGVGVLFLFAGIIGKRTEPDSMIVDAKAEDKNPSSTSD